MEATTSWTYGPGASWTWRQVRATASNAWEYISGDPTAQELLAESYNMSQSASLAAAAGIGIDSTTVSSAQTFGGTSATTGTNDHRAIYRGYPAMGYHKIYWLEGCNSATNVTFYSNTSNNAFGVAGMTGEIWQ